MSSSYNNRGGSGGPSSRRGRRGGSRQPSNIQNLPFEQGIICSLKESFGFIHCAERPEEIFFHYSEVTNCHPDDLQIDTEVEFKVGSSSSGGGASDKLAAFSVATIPLGTVVWETEEHEGQFYRGVVEKACALPRDGKSGPQTDGTVKVIIEGETQDDSAIVEESTEDGGDKEASDRNNSKKKGKKSGPIVRIRSGEYTGAKADNSNDESSGISSSSRRENSNSNRLFRGDLVEFRILLDRRTKQKYARQITLIQSDRDRKRIEKEKRMLENATQEEGIVVSLNNGFGFIKSNKRREDIYFHYSHLIIPDGEDDFELKKGQEVKFLVVTEAQPERQSNKNSNNRSNNVKVSARDIHCLPKGSVLFHTVEAKGVKGLVVRAPHPPSPGSRNDDSKMGVVRILHQRDGGDNESEPTNDSTPVAMKGDILLHFADAPGGVFTYQNHRNATASGVWIQEGDTLLFDVVKEIVDGSHRAVPTLHKIGLGGIIVDPESDADGTENATDETNNKDSTTEEPAIRLVSVSLVGRSEGVIHTLKPDYGFIHFAERPIDVHFKTYDLMPQELQDDIRRNMGIEELSIMEEGASVHFDICAHGSITTTTQRGRRRGAQQARENIRGQRIVILPKSTVALERNLTTNAKGVIKSINSQQLYTGSIELEEDVKPMSMDERHPLVAQMINSFLEESSLVNGRKSLVFRDTLGVNDDDVIVAMADSKGKGDLECSHIPVPGLAAHPGRICIRRVDKKEDGPDVVEVEAETETEKEITENAPKGKKNGKRSEKSKQPERTYKNIRFEKSSLDDSLKDDVPPSPGDIITCNVIQNRRTGKFLVKNLKIVERKYGEGNPAELVPTDTSGVGVVKDVVVRRNFGFISVLDENNTKSEVLFFHLPKGKRFAKGNEVKFDIALEGTKRVAINVESAPIGTIPSVASKNACLGYILMEPSHTTLSNTPVRKVAKPGSDKVGNSRWAETGEDNKGTVKQEMVEDGCILLLEDKTGMFQKKRTARRRKKASGSQGSQDSVDSPDDMSVEDTKSVGSTDDELSGEDDGILSILSRVNYKNGSIAIHGVGAAFSMDGSTNPKRADLVSFVRGKNWKTARDIRIVKRETAILQRGRLENIQIVETEDKKNMGKAQFIAATEKQEVYEVDLEEVVSCAASILKEKESMEGILHEGKIYGLCRTSDLYLASKLVGGSGKNRQRPKLNLTVKKDRGGTIMAQSMMAKGPDGTIGFKTGWTSRVSEYSILEEEATDDENAPQTADDVESSTKDEHDENIASHLKGEGAEDGTKGEEEPRVEIAGERGE